MHVHAFYLFISAFKML